MSLPNGGMSQTFERPQHVSIGGLWGELIERSCRHWLLRVNEDVLLDGFRKKPGIQAWIGEHAGKFLLAAQSANDLLKSDELESKIRRVVEGLVSAQEPDGYLGTYLPAERWIGEPISTDKNAWDLWVHKYSILALLAYYDRVGWQPALDAAVKAGLAVAGEYGSGRKDINKSDGHCGLASGSILEAIMLLYQHTGERQFLDFGDHIVRTAWESADGHQLVPCLRNRQPVNMIGRGKAYEMMSCFVGLLEYYRATGISEYLDMLLEARNRIADTQRYPTGGLTNNEYFMTPGLLPERADIETCVTFTWIQFNLRLFELTGDMWALELVEEAALNQLLPGISPQGETWTYFLPITGPKNFMKKGVQGVSGEPPGAPLTCCHTNGQRGLALVPQWFYSLTPPGELTVNFYGQSSAEFEVGTIGRVKIEQQTDFPRSNHILIKIAAEKPGNLTLLLRRPGWARKMTVDGLDAAAVDHRVKVRITGRRDLHVQMDLVPRLLLCGFEGRGKAVVALGPLVLAMENPPAGVDLDQIALLLGTGMPLDNVSQVTDEGWPALEVPFVKIPRKAVSDYGSSDFSPAGKVRLKPVMIVGIPQTESSGDQAVPQTGDRTKQAILSEYRVLLPYFWCP